jgi:hypothetical protein
LAEKGGAGQAGSPSFSMTEPLPMWRALHEHRRKAAAAAASLVTIVAPARSMAATYHAHDGRSLQAALASAASGAGPATIELSAGTFLPSSTLALSGEVTIVGPSAGPPAKLDGGAVSPSGSDLIVAEARSRLTLSNVEVTGGGAAGTGAAIDVFGALDLDRSTVAGNSGAGVLVQRGASATVGNSTVSDGLDVGIADLGAASLFNATIAGNAGGGVDDAGGALKLTNTIVSGNGSSDCTRGATTSDHSLDGDGSCGVGALSRTNPQLDGLAANGGPTLTRALGPASPAIDAGDGSRCPPEDQRHFVRPEGHCDIGAYQSSATKGPSRSAAGTGAGGLFEGTGGRLVGVRAHGEVRGARRLRITFSVRALIGHAHATFSYVDRARRVELRGLTVRSLAIDRRRGVATLRGSCLRMPGRRRVGVTVVLTSQSSRRSLRLGLSNGYFRSGALLRGSITFLLAK